MKKWISIILFLVTYSIFAQPADSLYSKGNENYKNGKYAEALKNYKALLSDGKKSAEVYYNVANTYYKLNQIAPSIYYYEKALMLEPNFEDAKHNLAFAQRMSIDAFEALPKTFIQRINEQFIYPISFNTWAWISVVFSFLIGVFFLMYYFSTYTDRKRFFFILGFISIFLGVISLSFAFKAAHHYKNQQPAIVFSPKVSVKSEPLLSAPESFVLHEGTKVQIEKKLDNWYKIKLSDGKIGWIDQESVKKIKD